MNRFFKLVVAALMAVFFTNTSIADNEGISIGIWHSQLDFDSYGYETDTSGKDDTEPDITSTSISKSVETGSIFVEYTAAQGSSIGIEYYPGEASIGSGSRTDTGTHGADSGTSDKTFTAAAEVEDIFTIYMEPTLMINDVFGVYGKVGLTTVHLLSLESLDNGTNSTVYPNEDIWGAMYGLGLKARHSSGIFLKLEGAITEFQHLELAGTGGNSATTIDADIDLEAVRLAVGYTF